MSARARLRRFLAMLAGALAGPAGPEPVPLLEAERARLSDERFRQLADHIADAFWIRSVDMRTLHYISPAFERIWGRSVASLYADPQAWSDFIVPEDRERVLAAFRAIGESPPLDIEYRIARPDGEVRWVRVRGFQVRDAAGVVIRHTGIVTDITDRRQVEAALQESEQRYRALVEWSPEPVAVTRAGTILFLNPAAVTMIGATSPQQLLGKPILDMVHPDYHAIVRERVRAGDQPRRRAVEARGEIHQAGRHGHRCRDPGHADCLRRRTGDVQLDAGRHREQSRRRGAAGERGRIPHAESRADDAGQLGRRICRHRLGVLRAAGRQYGRRARRRGGLRAGTASRRSADGPRDCRRRRGDGHRRFRLCDRRHVLRAAAFVGHEHDRHPVARAPSGCARPPGAPSAGLPRTAADGRGRPADGPVVRAVS